MKKVLAILLALMMGLSCVGAVAEEAADKAQSFLPMTVYEEYDVDQEAILNLLTNMFGMPEEYQPAAKAILAILDNLSEATVITEDGIQSQLFLGETSVIDVILSANEENLVLNSSLLPSFTVTISLETIMNMVQMMMEQYLGEAEEAAVLFSGVDFEALAANYASYVAEYLADVQEAIVFGEVETGEYKITDELVFNVAQPFSIEGQAVADAVIKMENKILKDENVAAIANTLKGLGLPFELPQELPADALNAEGVTLNGAVYYIADENGEVTANATAVLIDGYQKDVEEPAVEICFVILDGYGAFSVEVPSQNVVFTFEGGVDETGLMISCDLDAAGVYVGFDIGAKIDDKISFSAELYFMDKEKPIITESGVVLPGGELTLPQAVEGKTVLSVEEMMLDETGAAPYYLLMDLANNGLASVINNAYTAMPEEVSALINLFMPQTVEEAPAEEQAAEEPAA